MDDREIVDLFLARSEKAINELASKYGGLCHKISYNILNNAFDAEECVNDAYLGVWNSVPPNHPNPLSSYLCRIVRNISIKRYRTNTARKRNCHYDVALEEIEDCLSNGNTVEEEMDSRELTRIIEQFLDTLNVENRVIFMRRYWFGDSYQEIARQMGMTEKNISVRLTRMRRLMQGYLKERGVLL